MKVKPPINALAQYLMALAAVIGCYSLYLRHAVPVIEGPPNLIQRPQFTPLAELPSPREQKSHLVPYLPTDSWELSECKTLLTESGTILFKEFQEQPDGSLQVVPFTLFSGLDDQTDDDTNPDSDSTVIPTVVRCIDGANLKFDRPMADVYAGEGKAELETARLTGNVDIYRPPTKPKANDAFHVMTSNVQIDKRRIYTLDNVQLAFGPNKASGRNLLIDLEHEETPLGTDFSSISGVKRLELAFLHKLRIEPVGSNSIVLSNSSDTGARSNQSKIFSNQKSPIEVSCNGPFIFDFDNNVATFEQGVVAQQMDRFQDSIECEKLTLAFKEKEKQNENSLDSVQEFEKQDGQQTAASSPFDKSKGDLELKSFLAEGTPAIVVSRSSAAQITGESLSYDVETSKVIGRCDPQTDSMVAIVSDKYQMVSKELHYILTEDNSLGTVNAIGPGRMIRPKTENQDEFFASWSKSLTTQNNPGQSGAQRILLDGDTSVRIADQTQTNADKIEVLVWQVPTTKTSLTNTQVRTQPETQAKRENEKWNYQPFKIVAEGNVSIVSPKFSGFSQRMTAIWPQRTNGAQPDSITAQLKHQVGYRGRLLLQEHYGRSSPYNSPAPNFSPLTTVQPATPRATPFRSVRNVDKLPTADLKPPSVTVGRVNQLPADSGFVELANFEAEAAAENSTKPSELIADDRPENTTTSRVRESRNNKSIEFRGQDIEVRLQGSGKTTQIVDLTVVGDVRVLQTSLPSSDRPAKQPAEQPLLIKGDQLRLTPQGKDTYRAVVSSKSGKSASLSAKGFELFGSDVNLDQNANKLWVNGAGSMKINPESFEDRAAEKLEDPLNEAIKKSIPQNLDVNWKGGMIFDGAKIYFERNVVMSASQIEKPGKDGKRNRSQLKSLSEGLSVELSEPVNFAKLSSDSSAGGASTKTQIRELVFVNEIPESKRAFKLVRHTPVSDAKNRLVVVENRTFDSAGVLFQKQNIVVPNATFNVEAGGLYAKGPGTIATHQMGSASSASSNDSNPFARIAGDKKKKKGLSFIQINFDGELNIDPDQKEMTVDGNVRTIYAPIGSWEQSLNPDDGKKLAPRGSVNLRCNRLQLAQWTSRGDTKPVNEMLASGNAHLFSETFEATANRVSYSQATDVLVVEGTPRTDANLWFKQTPNDKNPTHLIAEKISYRISDQWTQTQGVKNLNINNK